MTPVGTTLAAMLAVSFMKDHQVPVPALAAGRMIPFYSRDSPRLQPPSHDQSSLFTHHYFT